MRAARNLGRSVAQMAIIVQEGLHAYRDAGHDVSPLPVVAYPEEEIREGSYLARVKKGEVTPPPYQLLRL